MELTSLPIEILHLLPHHLANLEDLVSLSSTCRTLHSICSATSPKTILWLAAASSRIFFRPDPHFLVAATVRQVSDWALLNHENTQTLRQAMQGGIYCLLNLCILQAQLSMDDIRRLHATRFTLINPISDVIDRCAGPQWYDTPDFWNGGVSNPTTIWLDPARSLFQIVIYGELFASTMQAFLEPKLSLPRFDVEFRMDYIKYCIPDEMCQSYEGMTVLPIGPYAKPGNESKRNELMPDRDLDQVGLNHLLGCRTWTEAWSAVREEIGPEFIEEWKQKIWQSAVQYQGLEGLEMLRPGGLEKWRPRLRAMRRSIGELEAEQQPKHGRLASRLYQMPDLAAEVEITISAYWGA